jgi:ketosteroid isomerase-like protein
MVSRPAFIPFIAIALLCPTPAPAQTNRPSPPPPELRQAVRQYDEALRRGDVASIERFWGDEYTFVSPTGERLTRDARLANLRAGRTAFDTVAARPREEQIRVYGDVAVHSTFLTLGGRYGGRAHRGDYRVLAVWVKRGGRWQQVAAQLTPVTAR